MAEYIEREAALALAESEEYLTPDGDEIYHEYIPVSAVKSIPAADVRPVVRGEWQFHMFTANSWGYECRVCHTTWDTPTNYCPNCGADMREDTDGR